MGTFIYDNLRQGVHHDRYELLIDRWYRYSGVPVEYHRIKVEHAIFNFDSLYGEVGDPAVAQYHTPITLFCRLDNYDFQELLARYDYEAEETFTFFMNKKQFENYGVLPSVGDRIVFDLPAVESGLTVTVTGFVPAKQFITSNTFFEWEFTVIMTRFMKGDE